tara:strand:- start:2733 stop:2960 length:228 start_codon:yes stop_codon:yes gene_type:complete
MDPFQIGDLVKYIYYEGGELWDAAERSNIAFILDIIEDPDEKQVDLFPKLMIYDTRLGRTVLTHAYNVEFISRAS